MSRVLGCLSAPSVLVPFNRRHTKWVPLSLLTQDDKASSPHNLLWIPCPTALHIIHILEGSFPFGLEASFRDFFHRFSQMPSAKAGASSVFIWTNTLCTVHCVYCQKRFGIIGPIQCLWKCIIWNWDSIYTDRFIISSVVPIKWVCFRYKGCREWRITLLWKVKHCTLVTV